MGGGRGHSGRSCPGSGTPVHSGELRYEARISGLPLQEILPALGHAGIDRLPPRILDNTLREFQELLYHTAGAAGKQDVESTSERDLFERYERIVNGALGDVYGLQFKEHVTARLRNEIEAREQLLQS